MPFNIFSFSKIKSIDVHEFETLKQQGYKIIDVRTPTEHFGARIENSILADIYSPDFKKVIEKLDKEENYLIYCRSGNRSRTACNFLMKWGFTNVLNLSGGIISWVNAGKEVVQN
ncbi:MAG: rhodanese-like domain-containing protein [Ignavibacteriae bacterium]|nr:rhodanese-like domain-containing protein [Ignavibacteriota bacterium]